MHEIYHILIFGMSMNYEKARKLFRISSLTHSKVKLQKMIKKIYPYLEFYPNERPGNMVILYYPNELIMGETIQVWNSQQAITKGSFLKLYTKKNIEDIKNKLIELCPKLNKQIELDLYIVSHIIKY